MLKVVNDGLFDYLASGTALVAALGGTAIYAKMIPLSANLPAVVFSFDRGGEDNDTPVEAVDVFYVIKAVSTSSRQAEALADLIKSRLHNATLPLGSGWLNYHTQLTQAVDYVEREKDGDLYYHSGGLYRIRMSMQG